MHPFKGNVDLEKLETLIQKVGAESIAYVSLADTVNIGGWLAVNDYSLFDKLRNMVVIFEGLHTYGGMAGRDMEALAIGMERGIVSAGRDPATGEHRYSALELTRLAIPRRVYTQAHMDVVAEAVKTVHDARMETRGLTMVYEPDNLRFFQARFEPIE